MRTQQTLPVLTSAQQQLLDQFNALIKTPDEAKLVEIIDQLDQLPDAVSPVTLLARNNDIPTIKRFIHAVKLKTVVIEKQRLIKELTDHLDYLARTDRLSYPSTDVDISALYYKLVTPIYRQTIKAIPKESVTNILAQLPPHDDFLIKLDLFKDAYYDHSQKRLTVALDECEKWLKDFFDSFLSTYFMAHSSAIGNYLLPCSHQNKDKEMKVAVKAFLNLISMILTSFENKHPDDVINIKKFSILINDSFDSFSRSIRHGRHALCENVDRDVPDECKKLFVEIIKLILQHLINKKQLTEVLEVYNASEITSLFQRHEYKTVNDVHTDLIRPVKITLVKNLAQKGDVEGVIMLIRKIASGWYFDCNDGSYEFKELLIKSAIESFNTANLTLAKKKMEFISKLPYENIFFDRFDEYGLMVREFTKSIIDGINKLGLNDSDLKISLLVDCLYKDTFIGKPLWIKRSHDDLTPALKRNELNAIVKQLETMKVDIAKLPGCGTYSTGFFKTIHPSKKDLEGKMPPNVIPMREVAVSQNLNAHAQAQAKDDKRDQIFQL